jgi:hypothetical protein
VRSVTCAIRAISGTVFGHMMTVGFMPSQGKRFARSMFHLGFGHGECVCIILTSFVTHLTGNGVTSNGG